MMDQPITGGDKMRSRALTCMMVIVLCSALAVGVRPAERIAKVNDSIANWLHGPLLVLRADVERRWYGLSDPASRPSP
jgi:hypothetical protein